LCHSTTWALKNKKKDIHKLLQKEIQGKIITSQTVFDLNNIIMDCYLFDVEKIVAKFVRAWDINMKSN